MPKSISALQDREKTGPVTRVYKLFSLFQHAFPLIDFFEGFVRVKRLINGNNTATHLTGNRIRVYIRVDKAWKWSLREEPGLLEDT